MEKILKLLLFGIFLVTFSGCQKNFDEVTKTNDENLFEIKEVLYAKDIDNSLSITDSDKVYNLDNGSEKTGLKLTFSLTDIDNNIVQKNEPVHMKVTVKNDSNIAYGIQQFVIEGNEYIVKNSFKNVISNVENLAFSTEKNKITFDDETYRLQLKPGDEFTIDFDYKYRKTSSEPEELFTLSFFALGNNGEVWYVELDESNVIFE